MAEPLPFGAVRGLPPAQRGAYAPDSAALAPLALGALRDGDVVLVKGSYGSRMGRIVESLLAPAAPRAVNGS